jgi:hypothetical protein
MYIDNHRRIRNAVRRKSPEKWRTSSWFFLHDNAPAHQSVLVKDFLAKSSVTTLQHPSYSLYSAAVDFYLFPRLKSALKGRRFCDATGIINNAMDELKRLLQRGLQECFQQIYNRWQMCIVARGNILKVI